VCVRRVWKIRQLFVGFGVELNWACIRRLIQGKERGSRLGRDRRRPATTTGLGAGQVRAIEAGSNEPGVNMETFGHDIRYAVRNLRKTPGFAVIAILTLALGIGASTAIFSVMENVLMEPFPYPDAQRFYSVFIHDTDRSEPGGRPAFIGPELLDYMEQNQAFDRAIANDRTDVLYRSGEGTERFDGYFVTPGTFEFLGMPALLGRVMQPADYEPGAPPVFVLRYKTWVKSFGADPGIVNKTFVLNGAPRTLIGIMPPRFGGTGTCGFQPSRAGRQRRESLPEPFSSTGGCWGI
jgi:hypothetical protein